MPKRFYEHGIGDLENLLVRQALQNPRKIWNGDTDIFLQLTSTPGLDLYHL